MKLINKNLKKGELKVKIENLDDLWYLSAVIDPNDIIKGKTVRKLKLGDKETRSGSVIKKSVFIKLKADKIEFTKDKLRIGGIIIEGPEDIPRGSHHTFTLEENSIITIIKERWLNFQLDKVNEACKEKKSKILICIFDREEAYFALLKKNGYELLLNLKGDVQKKAVEERIKGGFYGLIINTLKEYAKRYEIERIILASPSFWKEELFKELKDDDLRKKIIQATCSSADEKSINEVLKRSELKEALHEQRAADEMKAVEELLEEISKDGKAAYGIMETTTAVESGAAKTLLLTDNFIIKKREQQNFDKIESLMKLTEQLKGKVMIISSEHDAGRKLDGLGGIGSVLRYRVN